MIFPVYNSQECSLFTLECAILVLVNIVYSAVCMGLPECFCSREQLLCLTLGGTPVLLTHWVCVVVCSPCATTVVQAAITSAL